MRKVLIIDASPLFREFLKEKLAAEQIEAYTVNGKRDAFTKLITILPDLIVLDVDPKAKIEDYMEFLTDKHNDANTRPIPVIVSGPVVDRSSVARLSKFGIVKYFGKPIKFDIFFDSVGRILHSSFVIDTTPSVMEIHLNESIIFVEIARGLNREKILMLKYRLTEIIDSHKITNPKVVVMLSDMQLSFVDGANLELLFDCITADPRIGRSSVKVLSLDDFALQLIDGHPQYEGIEVVKNLKDVLPQLLANSDAHERTMSELVTNKILMSTDSIQASTVELQLGSDLAADGQGNTDSGSILKVAIVDDDAIVRKVLGSAFKGICEEVTLFSSGTEFISAVGSQHFDLIILDLYMPDFNGLQLLEDLQSQRFLTPIIVYSQAVQREVVVKALSLGAKSYLVKPQKPDVVLQKAIEVLSSR